MGVCSSLSYYGIQTNMNRPFNFFSWVASLLNTDLLRTRNIDVNQAKSHMEEHGYAIIPSVLNEREISEYISLFRTWFKDEEVNNFHKYMSNNGIFKYFEAGHQRFAWNLRTNPVILRIFEALWDTDELVCSFDGCCYFPKEYNKEPSYWTHTDQSPKKKGMHCIQSYVSLTDNDHRTLVVYDGSHKLHEHYFMSRGIDTDSDWHVLDKTFVKSIKHTEKTLHVKKGDMVIWDSRTFHQNTCGVPDCNEERLVQYLCYLPKNSENNNEEQTLLRKMCFNKKIMTSHWPYPIIPVNKQPTWLYAYHNIDYRIDYKRVGRPNLEDLLPEIEKLL